MNGGNRLVVGAVIALALASTVGPVRAGDPEVAAFLVEKAEKALRAKDYESAAADFQRARREHGPLPEAAYGLGQALEELERESEAIAAYRRCVAEVEDMEDASFTQRRAARRASSAIRRLRRRYGELDRATASFLKDLVAFARERKDDDPRWAKKACETVLRLDPSHREARRILDGLAAPEPKPEPETESKPAAGWGAPLVEADDLPGWDPGIRPPWTCRDRLVTVDAEGQQGKINWMDRVSMQGRFEVRAQVRVVRDGGVKRAYGFFLGDGKDRWHGVLIEDDDSLVLVEVAPGGSALLKDAAPRGFTPSKWHAFRLVVDRGDLSVYLDDVRVLRHTDDNPRAFGGKFGLFAQNGRFEFKNLVWKKQ